MSVDTELLRKARSATERLCAALQLSVKTHVILFPVKAIALEDMPNETLEKLESFLKRFEQLEDMLQRRLFREVLLAVGDDVAEMTVRDILNRIEKLAIIDNALEWMEIVKLRNKLAHDYPIESADRAQRVNDAWSQAPKLIDTALRTFDYIDRKGLLS